MKRERKSNGEKESPRTTRATAKPSAICSLVCTHELDNRRVNFTGTCVAGARSSYHVCVCVCVLSFYFSGFWIGFNFQLVQLLGRTASPLPFVLVTREYSSAEVFDCAREIRVRAGAFTDRAVSTRRGRSQVSSERTRRQLFRRIPSHLISLARLYFSPFESQLRDLFEVSHATIPNSKFKMRNNFLFFPLSLFLESRRDDPSREDGANRNKKQVDQFNSMLLERRDVNDRNCQN